VRWCLVLLVLLFARPAQAHHWGRSVGQVAWAIGQSQPKMGLGLRRAYARVVLRASRRARFDPFTLVAIVHNESRWNARVVGGRGHLCVGLGQQCLFDYAFCRHNYRGVACLARRAWLLNGTNNILEIASRLTSWRKLCRRVTGRDPLLYRVLHGYQGYGRLSRGILCGMRRTRHGWRDVARPRQVRRVMRYRRRLIRRLAHRGRNQ